MKRILLALAGAAAGGVMGYYAFVWILGQGFYALILPGALVGLGAALARNRFGWVAVVCGLLALVLGVFAAWSVWLPPGDDDSLCYYVLHLHERPPLTLIMIAVGGLLGLWIPYPRKDGGARW
jgi:hypothetical protein